MSEVAQIEIGGAVIPNGVNGTATRRSFTDDFKLDILAQVDVARAMPGGAADILQRNGLYPSHISEWRKLRDRGLLKPTPQTKNQEPEMLFSSTKNFSDAEKHEYVRQYEEAKARDEGAKFLESLPFNRSAIFRWRQTFLQAEKRATKTARQAERRREAAQAAQVVRKAYTPPTVASSPLSHSPDYELDVLRAENARLKLKLHSLEALAKACKALLEQAA